MISRLLVVAGAGDYPRLVVEGAKRAGVARVDVLSVKGSCCRATRKAADHVVAFAAGEADKAIEALNEKDVMGRKMKCNVAKNLI